MKARILILIACISLITAAALAHGGEEHVMGTVAQVTDKAITVKTAKAPVVVNVAATTKFIKDKAAAKIADLKVGDRVVIHAIEGEDEKLTADTVEFSSAAAPQSKTQSLTGVVSDTACGATHNMRNMTPAECTRACAMNGKYALVVGKEVYTLQGHETDLGKLAAQTVTVTGTVNGKTVTVASVVATKAS